MAEVAKGSLGVSVSTTLPGGGERLGTFPCVDAVISGDACYLNSSGVKLSSGAATGAASAVHGWAGHDANAGESVVLWANVNLGYGVDDSINPGTPLYLSSTVPGGLATVPTTGGVEPCALVLTGGRIRAIQLLAEISNSGSGSGSG